MTTLALVVSVLFLSGCSTSVGAEQKIRQEERIRADEQQKMTQEQQTKELRDWATNAGMDVKKIETESKYYGIDPNKVLEYTRKNITGK